MAMVMTNIIQSVKTTMLARRRNANNNASADGMRHKATALIALVQKR
eukprot:CAMPEP_0201865508 /NCGR_PEP_ID=MMETSP0902-20130614/364_1 /ASSEMBLY_ACC=CAM_ASM_000551 /TAXON_ID=420261 /ORGANISM="Thalassiosira antarctica, Strain CCMP982" /LENGTH=46 /DNA_ID= /DNA_START= /DNA_END= /DNA_ORIENTATION=